EFVNHHLRVATVVVSGGQWWCPRRQKWCYQRRVLSSFHAMSTYRQHLVQLMVRLPVDLTQSSSDSNPTALAVSSYKAYGGAYDVKLTSAFR
ncbi:hypothetical protein J6590_086586, partial [Homalodisca vitripennis]